MNKELEISSEVINRFEEFLRNHGITDLDNPERDAEKYNNPRVIIYGSDYYELESMLIPIVRRIMQESMEEATSDAIPISFIEKQMQVNKIFSGDKTYFTRYIEILLKLWELENKEVNDEL